MISEVAGRDGPLSLGLSETRLREALEDDKRTRAVLGEIPSGVRSLTDQHVAEELQARRKEIAKELVRGGMPVGQWIEAGLEAVQVTGTEAYGYTLVRVRRAALEAAPKHFYMDEIRVLERRIEWYGSASPATKLAAWGLGAFAILLMCAGFVSSIAGELLGWPEGSTWLAVDYFLGVFLLVAWHVGWGWYLPQAQRGAMLEGRARW